MQKATHIISFLHGKGFLEIKDEKMFLCCRKEMEDYCSFLRLLIRKQFEVLQPLDNEAFGIVEKIWNTKGGIRKFEEGLTEISGDVFLSFVENTSYSSNPDEFLEMLRSQSLLTYTKPCKNSDNSISNCVLKIDNMKWKHFTFSKFNQLINRMKKSFYCFHLFLSVEQSREQAVSLQSIPGGMPMRAIYSWLRPGDAEVSG